MVTPWHICQFWVPTAGCRRLLGTTDRHHTRGGAIGDLLEQAARMTRISEGV